MAERLTLRGVTLCAITSVNIAATVAALAASMDQIHFEDAILFTDSPPAALPKGLRTVTIERLGSSSAYSDFVLTSLADHIRTGHCLLIQWDGFVLDARQWDPGFLKFDYIGAPWPQFSDGRDVGNGGFSLRSRRLLEASRSLGFVPSHPEDVAIGRHNREMLEREHEIIFAPRQVAERFAFERTLPPMPTFGFHGIFNMVPILGEERFWRLYRTLDQRHLEPSDFRLLLRQLARSRGGWLKALQLAGDRLFHLRGPRPGQA